jgi:NAD(P)-dependent dehydrogenase (short-subunit alcohol dehydrogenase family)
MLFNNKVVIITGGGTGIGKATAKRFMQEGAKVVINGRRENVLEETAKELDPSGENVVYVAGDISVKSTSAMLVKKAVDTFGGVDILVCNTGIFNPYWFFGTQ